MGQHTGIAGNLKESDSHGGAFNICRDQSSEILGGFFTSSTGFDSRQLRKLKGHSFFLTDDADIGLLYDPARPGEADLCERWKASLEDCAPDLTVRRNYPYPGKNDGLTTWFRRRLPPGAYVGIELEVNQKHVARADRHWSAMRKVIVQSLCRVLAGRRAGISDPTTKTAAPPVSRGALR